MVEDAQQRRGLGSILLEHLAAAAQERGIAASPPRCWREQPDGPGFHRRRLRGSASTTPGSSIWGSTSSRPRTSLAVALSREQRAEARVDRPAAAPASVAVDRRLQRDRQARPRGAGEPAARRLRRPGLPGQPGGPVGAGRAAPTRRSTDIPDAGRPRRRHRAGRRGGRGGGVLPGQAACTALVVVTGGSPRPGRTGWAAAAADGRRWPGRTGCGCSGRTAWAW